jgi:hypothetical protein
MRRKIALLFVGLFLWCPVVVGQEVGRVHGNVFREATMGLTYEFPEKFTRKSRVKHLQPSVALPDVNV